MLKNWKSLLVAIVVLGLSADFAVAQKPIKNSPPPPPPVYYQAQFWAVGGPISGYPVPGLLDINQVYDSNSRGQTVGAFRLDLDGDGAPDANGSRAYLYDPAVNLEYAVDLNQIVQGIPEGSVIRQARAINEAGQIAAYLASNDGSTFLPQPVVIDLTQQPPRLYAIPDRDLTDYSTSGDINNAGDLAVSYRHTDGSFGHYICNFDFITKQLSPIEVLDVATSDGRAPRINDAGDIVGPLGDGDAYRWKKIGSFERFTGLLPIALNEAGAFSGRATVTSSKNRQTYRAFVCGTSLRLFEDSFNDTGIDLNESGDVLRRFHLYHSGLNTTFVLKDLLDPRDPDTVFFEYISEVFCYTMTHRDTLTNFPVLTGTYGRLGLGFQLIPVRVPK
jgi:hypothetical protein